VRFRKLIGAVALFVLVLAWALIAMAVAQFPAIRDTAARTPLGRFVMNSFNPSNAVVVTWPHPP
jgi:hypothetical protein